MIKAEAEPVGVIGLGPIGFGVAHSFFTETQAIGFDINPNALSTFVEAGGKAKDAPACRGKNVRIVILFVVNAEQAQLVVFGKNGLLDSLQKNSIIISCVTMAPDEIRAIGDKLHSFGVTMIDKLTSGGLLTQKRDGTNLWLPEHLKQSKLFNLHSMLLPLSKFTKI